MCNLTDEALEIVLTKKAGTRECEGRIKTNNHALAIWGLSKLIEGLAEETETSVEHVLVVLTTVLLAPQNENTDSRTSLRTGSE